MATTAPQALQTLQSKFQVELEKYTKAQKKNDKLVAHNSQLETQLHENEMVKEELGFCKADAKVFKLVGDVLVPQTLEEARSNVQRRIEFIANEEKRNMDLIAETGKELTSLREVVGKMEMDIKKSMMGIQQQQQ